MIENKQSRICIIHKTKGYCAECQKDSLTKRMPEMEKTKNKQDELCKDKCEYPNICECVPKVLEYFKSQLQIYTTLVDMELGLPNYISPS